MVAPDDEVALGRDARGRGARTWLTRSREGVALCGLGTTPTVRERNVQVKNTREDDRASSLVRIGIVAEKRCGRLRALEIAGAIASLARLVVRV